MPDPKLRDEMARDRDREDQILRQDMRGGRRPGPAPRHFKAMVPGKRMYGENDSVVAYFAGHAWRGIKALGRLVSSATRRRAGSSNDLRDSIKYRDFDGK